MSKELDNYYHCPSCGVPFDDHLGLVGICKLLKEARDNQEYGWKSCREATKANQAEYELRLLIQKDLELAKLEIARLKETLENWLNVDRVWLERGDSRETRDLANKAVKLTREALSPSAPAERGVSQTQYYLPADRRKTEVTSHSDAGKLARKLGNAFAGIKVTYPPESKARTDKLITHQPPPVSDKPGSVEQVSDKGEWRTFVPSPENPFQEGDQWQLTAHPTGWSTVVAGRVGGHGTSVHARYRRFHPATKESQ